MHWWEELSDQEQCHLLSELEEVDLEEMESMWRRTCGEDSVKTRDMSSMEPVQADLCDSILTSSHDNLDLYINTTLRAIAAGQVGVLLLAGGQGTRLGVNYPKGMYNIGLPSNKTLYQIQMERILRLEEMSARVTGVRGRIQMYIMTSEATREPTLEFLGKNE